MPESMERYPLPPVLHARIKELVGDDAEDIKHLPVGVPFVSVEKMIIRLKVCNALLKTFP